MLGVMTSMVAAEPFDLLERCGVPQRTGLTVPRLAPFGVYPAADGYVAICAPTEAFAQLLFHAIDRPELCEDERFRTRDARVRHVVEVDSILGDFTRTRSKADVLSTLACAGVPAAEVRDPAEAVRDPRVVARGETVRLRHSAAPDADVYGPGLPIVFSDTTIDLDQAPPGIGEHNQEVYGALLGYTAAELEAFRSTGVI
jgi:crotonobetainyl-CoA:carnitine CoA-transferase CaiB-like acyl-CoA transferase